MSRATASPQPAGGPADLSPQAVSAKGAHQAQLTPGPWEVVPANEHHGAYVVGPFGGDVCDLYSMSDPSALSFRNGGTSIPIPFAGADANAHLIAAAPYLYEALETMPGRFEDASNNPCTCNIDENACPYCNAWQRVVNDLNRLLAKARGETPDA